MQEFASDALVYCCGDYCELSCCELDSDDTLTELPSKRITTPWKHRRIVSCRFSDNCMGPLFAASKETYRSYITLYRLVRDIPTKILQLDRANAHWALAAVSLGSGLSTVPILAGGWSEIAAFDARTGEAVCGNTNQARRSERTSHWVLKRLFPSRSPSWLFAGCEIGDPYVPHPRLNGCVRVYDLNREGETLKEFSGHSKSVRGVSANRERGIVISGSRDSSLRFWDLRTTEQLDMIRTRGAALCVDCLEEKNLVASGESGRIVILDLRQRSKVLKAIKLEDRRPLDMVCLPEETFLSSGTQGLSIWNAVDKSTRPLFHLEMRGETSGVCLLREGSTSRHEIVEALARIEFAHGKDFVVLCTRSLFRFGDGRTVMVYQSFLETKDN